MHLILALDTSLSMYRQSPEKSNLNNRYIDISHAAIESFIDYTSDSTHNNINEIALITFAKEISYLSPFVLNKEQLDFIPLLKEKINKGGPGGSCNLIESLLNLEKTAKEGLGDDSFIDIFLITNKKFDQKLMGNNGSNFEKELLDKLDRQTRLFIFYFSEVDNKTDNDNEANFVQKFQQATVADQKERSHPTLFFDRISSKNDENFKLSELLGEKMIHRFTTHIAELVVNVKLGTLEDKATLFPQPRTVVLNHNSVFDIVGFISMDKLIGLPIISRHCLMPRGLADDPNLLQFIAQGNIELVKNDSSKQPYVALVEIYNCEKVKKENNNKENENPTTKFLDFQEKEVKQEGIYGLLTLMDFKTTSTNFEKAGAKMQTCLLLIDEIPWLGPLENLDINPRFQALQNKININPKNNENEYFPIAAGVGAYLSEVDLSNKNTVVNSSSSNNNSQKTILNQKSYHCPYDCQIWNSGEHITNDYGKLMKLMKKTFSNLIDGAKVDVLQKELNKFRRNVNIFKNGSTSQNKFHNNSSNEIETVLLETLLVEISKYHDEKKEKLKSELLPALAQQTDIHAQGALEQLVVALDTLLMMELTAKALTDIKPLLNTDSLLLSYIKYRQFDEIFEYLKDGLKIKRSTDLEVDLVLPRAEKIHELFTSI